MSAQTIDFSDPHFSVDPAPAKPLETEVDEEESLVADPENTGMDIGTTYKEDKEQDLDDLIHSQPATEKNKIPPPEEV